MSNYDNGLKKFEAVLGAGIAGGAGYYILRNAKKIIGFFETHPVYASCAAAAITGTSAALLTHASSNGNNDEVKPTVITVGYDGLEERLGEECSVFHDTD